MQIHLTTLAACLVGAMSLSACSPEHNWRDIAFEGSALKVQLPCKPDRTTRSVPLGGVPVDLQVAGCERGTAMVAVMSAALPAGVDVSAVLAAWQKATLDNARVPQPLVDGQQQIWHRPGQLPLTASVRVQAPAQRANGQALNMDAVWGAVAEGEKVRLVHAVVYDAQKSVTLANTLFEGIKP